MLNFLHDKICNEFSLLSAKQFTLVELFCNFFIAGGIELNTIV